MATAAAAAITRAAWPPTRWWRKRRAATTRLWIPPTRAPAARSAPAPFRLTQTVVFRLRELRRLQKLPRHDWLGHSRAPSSRDKFPLLLIRDPTGYTHASSFGSSWSWLGLATVESSQNSSQNKRNHSEFQMKERAHGWSARRAQSGMTIQYHYSYLVRHTCLLMPVGTGRILVRNNICLPATVTVVSYYMFCRTRCALCIRSRMMFPTLPVLYHQCMTSVVNSPKHIFFNSAEFHRRQGSLVQS